MHEVDMTRALLLAMEGWRQSHAPQVPRVGTVHLQVGSFTCVEPDQLVFTWQVAISNSWLEGAELAIEPVALLGRCLRCSATYAPEPERGYRSPCCEHPMEEIVRGRELRISSVDYHLLQPGTATAPIGAVSRSAPVAPPPLPSSARRP
jgi:hydrogenase nickel incorporation protein HypA/HybF